MVKPKKGVSTSGKDVGKMPSNTEQSKLRKSTDKLTGPKDTGLSEITTKDSKKCISADEKSGTDTINNDSKTLTSDDKKLPASGKSTMDPTTTPDSKNTIGKLTEKSLAKLNESDTLVTKDTQSSTSKLTTKKDTDNLITQSNVKTTHKDDDSRQQLNHPSDTENTRKSTVNPTIPLINQSVPSTSSTITAGSINNGGSSSGIPSSSVQKSAGKSTTNCARKSDKLEAGTGAAGTTGTPAGTPSVSDSDTVRRHSRRHAQIPSHLPNSHGATYHRQYSLLRDKGVANGSPLFSPALGAGGNSGLPAATVSLPGSPQLSAARSMKSIRGRLYPKRESSKYVFSVDDDEDEVEQDLSRQYMDDYGPALRRRYRQQSLQQPQTARTNSAARAGSVASQSDVDDNFTISGGYDDNTIRKMPSRYSVFDESSEVDNSGDAVDGRADVGHTDRADEGTIRTMLSGRWVTATTPSGAAGDPALEDADMADAASVSSAESFTLRERQAAINETHPFGIKIWKPAVYKKHRSVETEANNDIHSTPRTAGSVGRSVKVFNVAWSLTFGLVLCIVCWLAGLFVGLLSIFTNHAVNDSYKYADLFFTLGGYFFRPFGKIVLLNTDKHYMHEDAHIGTSLAEFRRWRAQNEGRLFFSAPNAMKAHVSEATPLRDARRGYGAGNGNGSTSGSSAGGATVGTSSANPASVTESTAFKERVFGRGQWNAGRVCFFLIYYFILLPLSGVIAFIQWLGVFTIPMAKVLTILLNHLRMHPLALSFEPEKDYYEKRLNTNSTTESILICTYRSFGLHYYKYTVDGTNIFFINLNFLVVFTIFDYYFLRLKWNLQSPITDPSLIFVLCLASIIPLAYFIGQAVASISAQTSMGVGAVINAFFSTIVEVFLYTVALNQSKGKLVEGSIIGSILGAVLLLPGTSMCSGAIRRKTQRYNPASAGVSSTMLLYSILVMFSPTILHQIFGRYEQRCEACKSGVEGCQDCHYMQSSITIDRLYIRYLKPFSLLCSLCLFTAYCIGLLFTLKTHAAMIWSNPASDHEKKAGTLYTPETSSYGSAQLSKKPSRVQQPDSSFARTLSRAASFFHGDGSAADGASATANTAGDNNDTEGGHDSPNWSRTKSTTILLLATITYAIIAEILVGVVDDVLKKFPISAKFLGLTVFALVPNTTEFINAILFAMHGNVALSMEIGSAYALQVCLLQIPILVVYSCWTVAKAGIEDVARMFTLIFPRWDFMACLMSVYMFTYVYAEGKSNYFKGSILILLYIAIIVGFYIAVSIDDKYESIAEGVLNGIEIVA